VILDRTEFADYFNSLDSRLGGPDSPLWIPDDFTPSQWFVCVKPIGVHRFKFSYFDWCNKTLAGRVRCYSSDPENQKEWWGFTDKNDIALWMLKWM
jgi:hypothetical protein